MAFRVFSTVLVYATALDSAYAFAPAHRVRIPHGSTRMDSNIRMVATTMPIQVLPLVTDNNYDEGEHDPNSCFAPFLVTDALLCCFEARSAVFVAACRHRLLRRLLRSVQAGGAGTAKSR